MRGKATYRIIKFKNFDTNIRAAINEVMANAIKVFVDSTASKIPVWSGQARGTLANVADRFGVDLDFSNNHSRRVSRYKNPLTGRALSSYKLDYTSGIAYFEWRTSLNYMVAGETGKTVSPTSPWRSLPYARGKVKNFLLNYYGEAIRDAILASITYKRG